MVGIGLVRQWDSYLVPQNVFLVALYVYSYRQMRS